MIDVTGSWSYIETMNLFDRFTAKYIPEPNSGCWLWLSTMSNGRAMIWEPPMTTLAARVACRKLFNGRNPLQKELGRE